MNYGLDEAGCGSNGKSACGFKWRSNAQREQQCIFRWWNFCLYNRYIMHKIIPYLFDIMVIVSINRVICTWNSLNKNEITFCAGWRHERKNCSGCVYYSLCSNRMLVCVQWIVKWAFIERCWHNDTWYYENEQQNGGIFGLLLSWLHDWRWRNRLNLHMLFLGGRIEVFTVITTRSIAPYIFLRCLSYLFNASEELYFVNWHFVHSNSMVGAFI